MTGLGRTAAASSLLAILGGLTTLLSRQAWAAEPSIAECLTAYEDSVSLRKNHQLKATLAKLALCSSDHCPADIRAECLRRVPEIDASMPTVVFEARDAAGMTLAAVKVKVDGDVLAERLRGAALPIDPGEHTFLFEVAGRPSVEKQLLILEGDKLRRERVEFEALAAPKPVTPPPPPTLATVETLEQRQASPVTKPLLGKARTGALVLGGVGVAAIGLGVAYGWIAMSRRDDASKVCPNHQCTDKNGDELWDGARSAGNISTGAFIVGAAGIASGVVVWLLAKPPADGVPRSQISLGPAGLQVLHRW